MDVLRYNGTKIWEASNNLYYEDKVKFVTFEL